MGLRRNLLALTAVLAIVACATPTLAPSGAFDVGSVYTIQLAKPWSDISPIMGQRPDHVRLLSRDGPALNRLYLSSGVPEGGYLVRPTAKDKPTPSYRRDMNETEIAEFIVDSVAAMGYQRPESANLRPASFGGVDGIRLDLAATTDKGLDMAGTALVAASGGSLRVMLFIAPKEHYFDALMPDVEQIMASAAAVR